MHCAENIFFLIQFPFFFFYSVMLNKFSYLPRDGPLKHCNWNLFLSCYTFLCECVCVFKYLMIFMFILSWKRDRSSKKRSSFTGCTEQEQIACACFALITKMPNGYQKLLRYRIFLSVSCWEHASKLNVAQHKKNIVINYGNRNGNYQLCEWAFFFHSRAELYKCHIVMVARLS